MHRKEGFFNDAASYHSLTNIYALKGMSTEAAERPCKRTKDGRPQFEAGDVVDATYHIGYWLRHLCLEVVEHKKGRPPVFRKLKMEVLSSFDNHSQSTTVCKLKQPLEPADDDTLYKARWQPAQEIWAFKYDRDYKVSIDGLHKEGTTYESSSYY